MALCSFARLLQAFILLGVGAEILWHPGLGASYGMLQICGIVSYDKSETTSGMQFVAILFISGLRLAIQKKSISLKANPQYVSADRKLLKRKFFKIGSIN